MVDTSPPLGMSNTAPVDPVREYFFVADHHADPEEVEANCRAQGVRGVKLPVRGPARGLDVFVHGRGGRAFGLLEDLGPKGRAAAALGIYTDTSALLHGSTPLDFRMFESSRATRRRRSPRRPARLPRAARVVRVPHGRFEHMETKGGVRIAPWATCATTIAT
jgi:hypothetical protein